MCTICNKPECPGKTYPLMVERFAAGRDVDHWRATHDRINGLAPMNPAPPSPEDRALREYMQRHGCGGCG